MTLAQWLDRWLDEYAAPRLRESTMDGYRMYAEQYIKPRLGGKKMTSVTAADIQRLYTKLRKEGRVHEHPEYGHKLSANTVRRIHTMLHRAMADAVRAHIIPRNPADGVTLPKVNTMTKHVLTDKELDEFMETIKADPLWYDFFYTELTTGLRRGEICGLMWSDFDERNGTLDVRRTLRKEKGGRLVAGDTKTYAGTRKIVLPPSTAELLRARKKKSFSPWIFHDPLRPEAPISPDSAYRRLKTLLKQAGLPDIPLQTCICASRSSSSGYRLISTIKPQEMCYSTIIRKDTQHRKRRTHLWQKRSASLNFPLPTTPTHIPACCWTATESTPASASGLGSRTAGMTSRWKSAGKIPARLAGTSQLPVSRMYAQWGCLSRNKTVSAAYVRMAWAARF